MNDSPMADTASQLTLPEALEIAKQKQHGDVDPTVAAFLGREIDEIMRRLQAQPSTYVFTKDEFAVVNYYRVIFGDNEIAQQAIRRYWKQYPAEPNGNQEQHQSEELREEISKSAFSALKDSFSLALDHTQTQNGSQESLPYLNWKDADRSPSNVLTRTQRSYQAYSSKLARKKMLAEEMGVNLKKVNISDRSNCVIFSY